MVGMVEGAKAGRLAAVQLALLATALAVVTALGAFPVRDCAWAAGAGDLRATPLTKMVIQAYESHTTGDGWVWLESEGGSATLVGYMGRDTAIVVPGSVGGMPVEGVVAKASTGAPAAKSVDLSACSSTLRTAQFYGLSLESVDASRCTSLQQLDVRGNAISQIKVPPSIRTLLCSDNSLSALDVSACEELEVLDCANNSIRSLDVAPCGKLRRLDCSDNLLTSLSVGANTSLRDLVCHGNYIADGRTELAERFGSDTGVVMPQNAGLPPAEPSTSGGGEQAGQHQGGAGNTQQPAPVSGKDANGGSASTSSASNVSNTPSTSSSSSAANHPGPAAQASSSAGALPGAGAPEQQVASPGAKKANTLVVKSKKITVRYSKLKKTSQVIKRAKAFKVSGAKGKVSYKKRSGNKKIVVSKAGKVTVEKGLKRATYKLKVKVTAAGTAEYEPATRTVSLMIKVS